MLREATAWLASTNIDKATETKFGAKNAVVYKAASSKIMANAVALCRAAASVSNWGADAIKTNSKISFLILCSPACSTHRPAVAYHPCQQARADHIAIYNGARRVCAPFFVSLLQITPAIFTLHGAQVRPHLCASPLPALQRIESVAL